MLELFYLDFQPRNSMLENFALVDTGLSFFSWKRKEKIAVIVSIIVTTKEAVTLTAWRKEGLKNLSAAYLLKINLWGGKGDYIPAAEKRNATFRCSELELLSWFTNFLFLCLIHQYCLAFFPLCPCLSFPLPSSLGCSLEKNNSFLLFWLKLEI